MVAQDAAPERVVSTRRCEECGERGWTDDGWTCEGCSLWSHLWCEEPSTDEYDGSRWCGACWPEQKRRIEAYFKAYPEGVKP